MTADTHSNSRVFGPYVSTLLLALFSQPIPAAEEDIAWLATVAPVTVEEMRAVIREYDERIRLNPKTADLYIKSGAAYLRLHRFDEAIFDFDEAIELADADQAYFARGLARGRNREFDAAIADISVYIDRHPDSSIAYTKRGIRYLWKGDRQRAQQNFARAIELDDTNAEAYDDLGVVLAQQQKLEEALQYLRAAVRLEPNFQKAHHNLAMVYYLSGHDSNALTVVEKSLQLRPSSRDSLMLKAEILSALGRHDEAKIVRDEAEFLVEGNWSERALVK